MYRQSQKAFRKCCLGAFESFSKGLSNAEIFKLNPQLLQYNFREVIQINWELVVDEMEQVAKRQILTLNREIYEQAKQHFFGTLVGSKRWLFKGYNANPYGEKLTKKFLQICRFFIKEDGSLKKYNSVEIIKVLKAINRIYIIEYGITSKNLSRANKKVNRTMQIESEKEKQIPEQEALQPEAMDVQSSVSTVFEQPYVQPNPKKDIIQKKKKELERLKIQNQILEGKAKILKLENEVILLENSTTLPQATDLKEKAYKLKPVKTEHVANKVQSIKPQKTKHRSAPEQMATRPIEVTQQSIINAFQSMLQSTNVPLEEKEKSKVVKAVPQKAKKQSKNHIAPIQQKKSFEKPPTGDKVLTPPKRKSILKKQSIKPLQAEPHPTQILAIDSKDKKKAKKGPKQKQKQVIETPVTTDDSKDWTWKKEEEHHMIQCLKTDPTISQGKLIELLTKKFGQKYRFRGSHIKNKKDKMFKRCYKRLFQILRVKKLFKQDELKNLQEFCESLATRTAAIEFMNKFIGQFYTEQPVQRTSEDIISFVDEIYDLKKKLSNQKTKKKKAKPSTFEEDSAEKGEMISQSPSNPNLNLQKYLVPQSSQPIQKQLPKVIEAKTDVNKHIKGKQKIEASQAPMKRHFAIRSMNQNNNLASDSQKEVAAPVLQQKDIKVQEAETKEGSATNVAIDQKQEKEKSQKSQKSDVLSSMMKRFGGTLKDKINGQLKSVNLS